MADLEFDNFDSSPQEMALADYLSSTLEEQVGKSEARFKRFLAEQDSIASRPPAFHRVNRFAGWTLGLAGAALAASLAALWAGPSIRQMTPEKPVSFPSPVNPTLAQSPLLVRQNVESQTFDDGTVMIDDDTPVRILRRHDLQRTQWFGQDDKMQREEVEPQDHVVLVHMKTY